MQANADPAEIERFAKELKEFTSQLMERSKRLNGQFNQLGDTWRDQEQQKFAQEFEQTMRVIAQFSRSADQQIPFLVRKATRLREYLNQK